MKEEAPSRTAWRVAARRAAHQMFDAPLVFEDPLALRILGDDAVTLIEKEAETREQTRVARALRAFMAVRSRVAEDTLAAVVQRGAKQVVILGAGLDTFAYRNPFADRVRVFEVDYPATQTWKRHLLENAQMAIPESLTFVPVDFERQTLSDRLREAGFDDSAPAFFSWLGVTMYLASETVMNVLAYVGSLPEPSGVVFDYAVSPAMLGFVQRMAVQAFAARVAAIGEPWTSYFEPEKLVNDLRTRGFRDVHDLSPEQINERYFRGRTDGLVVGSLGRLMVALR